MNEDSYSGELGHRVNDACELFAHRTRKFCLLGEAAFKRAATVDRDRENPMVEVTPGMWKRKYKRKYWWEKDYEIGKGKHD